MKKLIFILMVSSLYGDMIHYRKDGSGFQKKVECQYLGVYDENIFFMLNKQEKMMSCSDVMVIYDYYEEPIQFNCFQNTYIPNDLIDTSVKEINNSYFGGVFIALGAGMLAFQYNKDFEDIDDWDAYKDTNTIAYILIGVGGVLIAIGI